MLVHLYTCVHGFACINMCNYKCASAQLPIKGCKRSKEQSIGVLWRVADLVMEIRMAFHRVDPLFGSSNAYTP